MEEVVAQLDHRRADGVGVAEHAGGRGDLAQHQRRPRPGDAGLLLADGLAVGAKPVGVVDVHGGDYRHVRVDHVDRVQPAAQADFQHGQVQPGALEQPQRGQRAVFEIGQRRMAARGLDRLEPLHQRRVVGLHAVDAHPLVVAPQVRRGVGADLPAAGAGDGLEEGHGRALAVGAADRDDLARRLAQAHRLGHRAHALQAQFDGAGMLGLDVAEPIGQGAGGGDGHRAVRSVGGRHCDRTPPAPRSAPATFSSSARSPSRCGWGGRFPGARPGGGGRRRPAG